MTRLWLPLAMLVVPQFAHTQVWSLPEVLWERQGDVLILHAAAMDERGAFHFILEGQPFGREAHMLFYLRLGGDEAPYQAVFAWDTSRTTLILGGCQPVFGPDYVAHVVWHETPKGDPMQISELYYSSVVSGQWQPPQALTQRKGEDPTRGKVTLLGQYPLVAYWITWGDIAGLWFSYWEAGQWKSPFLPFFDLSWDYRGHMGDARYADVVVDPRDSTMHVAVIGATAQEIDRGVNSIYYFRQHAAQRHWSRVVPTVVERSSTIFHFIRLTMAPDGTLYAFWEAQASEALPYLLDLYYSISTTGQRWSLPRKITPEPIWFLTIADLAVDSSGVVHVLYGSFRHWYVQVKGEDLLGAVVPSPTSEGRVVVDRHNRLHLFWGERPDEDPTKYVLKHVWRDLPGTGIEAPSSLVQRHKPGGVSVSCFPNPTNGKVWLTVEPAAPSWLTVRIYNMAGQEVRTLATNMQAAGTARLCWDGLDDLGRAVPSGIYWCRVGAHPEAGSQEAVATAKLLMLR